MPYTDMFVSGLGMGFSSSELESMPYHALLWFLHQSAAMRKGDGGNGVQGSSKTLAAM